MGGRKVRLSGSDDNSSSDLMAVRETEPFTVLNIDLNCGGIERAVTEHP